MMCCVLCVVRCCVVCGVVLCCVLSSAASPLLHLTSSSHIITYSIMPYLYLYITFKCNPEIPTPRPDRSSFTLIVVKAVKMMTWIKEQLSLLLRYNTILKRGVFSISFLYFTVFEENP